MTPQDRRHAVATPPPPAQSQGTPAGKTALPQCTPVRETGETAPPATGAALAVAAALLALAAFAGLSTRAAERRLASHAGNTCPLASLAAPIGSYTWDLAFWSTHQTARTPLWRAALAFCIDKREAAFPACTAVRLASWWRPAGSDLTGSPPRLIAPVGDLAGPPPRVLPPVGQEAVPAIAATPTAGHERSTGRTARAAESRP